MSRRNIVVVVIAAILLVAAVIGVIVGVRTHTETDVMGACWTGAKVTRYEPEGANECPPLLWPEKSAPLTVMALTNNPNPVEEPQKASQHAIAFINQRLGYEALALSGGGRPDVLTHIGVPQDSSWTCPGGHTWHERDSTGRMYATVETSNTGDISTLHAVLIHEYLHALGLGHDDWEGSIMFVRQESTWEGIPFGRLWISDHDTSWLRSRYAPR